MREIKFRAWDTQKKGMLHFDNEDMWDTNWIETDYIMQYTGIKDKNGKEIYEDDKVRLEGREREYVVKFSFGCFKLFHLGDDGLNGFPWGTIGRVGELGWTIEIIGNIHENPELLK